MARDILTELKALFGKPIDSEEVVKFLAKYPKHKVTKPSDGHQGVVALGHGLEMDFGPLHGGFHGGRTKESRVLTTLFLHSNAEPKFKAYPDLPLGLSFNDGPEQVIAILGPPVRSKKRDNGEIVWAHWQVDGLILAARFNEDQPERSRS
jgi:hypothetical protein